MTRHTAIITHWNSTRGTGNAWNAIDHVEVFVRAETLVGTSPLPRMVGQGIEFSYNLTGFGAAHVVLTSVPDSVAAYARIVANRKPVAPKRAWRGNSAERAWLTNDGIRVLTDEERAYHEAILTAARL